MNIKERRGVPDAYVRIGRPLIEAWERDTRLGITANTDLRTIVGKLIAEVRYLRTLMATSAYPDLDADQRSSVGPQCPRDDEGRCWWCDVVTSVAGGAQHETHCPWPAIEREARAQLREGE